MDGAERRGKDAIYVDGMLTFFCLSTDICHFEGREEGGSGHSS